MINGYSPWNVFLTCTDHWMRCTETAIIVIFLLCGWWHQWCQSDHPRLKYFNQLSSVFLYETHTDFSHRLYNKQKTCPWFKEDHMVILTGGEVHLFIRLSWQSSDIFLTPCLSCWHLFYFLLCNLIGRWHEYYLRHQTRMFEVHRQ